MSLQIARISDNFTLPDGRVVHGEFFTHLMYGSEGISNFQFHQTAPDKIVLYIVLGLGNASFREQHIRNSIQMIRALSPAHDIKVEVCETPAIPLSSAGKHRFTRSDVVPSKLACSSK